MKAGIILLIVVLLYLLIVMPSPIFGFPWKSYILDYPPVLKILAMSIPESGGFSFPLLQWLIWGLCGAFAYFAVMLFQHMMLLASQGTRPLKEPRTYLRLRVPATSSLDPKSGESLLRSLHGVLPPAPVKPDGKGVPIVLRWSGLPDQPIRQGVSVLLPSTQRISVEKTMEGLTDGTMVDEQPDPLLNAVKYGMTVAWVDLMLAAPDTYPLAIAEGKSKPLLEGLLPALAAPAGVAATDVQVMLRPITSTDWRLKVQMMADRLKIDTTAPERKTTDKKAAGPGYDTTIRVVVVADSPDLASGYLGTIVGNFAATAQTIGTAQQRLRPTRIQTYTVPDEKPPEAPGQVSPEPVALEPEQGKKGKKPKKAKKPKKGKPEEAAPDSAAEAKPPDAPGAGGAEGNLDLEKDAPGNGASEDGKKGKKSKKGKPAKAKPEKAKPAEEKSPLSPALQRVLMSVPAARNPLVVPLIAPWLGHKPVVLSVAELATLWHPPTSSLLQRVETIMARWLPVPQKAFVDASDPRNLVMGTGRKADSSWAPIGLEFADLRYVMWITAPMGRGKSVWLQHMFSGLMRADAGCMLVDCKGTDLVKDSLPLVPLNREQDVVIVSFGGTTITGEDLRVSMNLLSPEYGRSLGLDATKQAATVLGLFPAIDPRFDDAVGIKQFANMGLLALSAGEPNATMSHLMRFFGDEEYRAQVTANIPGEMAQVKDFWQRRFDEMPDSQKSSLASFERRLDQLLTYPELAAMLIAPGCSIDMRQMMDNKGILMAGVKATEGQIATIGGTLLLTQMLAAALSRDNVPQKQRPDWPLIIDEAHIILGDNAGLAKVMFSQLRSFRIGQVIVHQGINQFPPPVLIPLRDNAQYRVILGSEAGDASTYASQYSATGVTAQDFTQMERFEHQYLKFLGTQLFSSRMLPMPKPLEEEPLPPVEQHWSAARAPATNDQEKAIDQLHRKIDYLVQQGGESLQQAVDELATLCRQRPDQYDAYCARTKAHRLTQRQFILNHPGAIQDKETRIRVLSALKTGVPRVETAALQWALLQDTAVAAEAAAAEAAAKKGKGKGKGKSGSVSSAVIPGMAPSDDEIAVAPVMSKGKTSEELARERAKRGADMAEGF